MTRVDVRTERGCDFSYRKHGSGGDDGVIQILRQKGKRRRTKLAFNANDPKGSDWLPTSDELDDEVEEEAVADGLDNDCDGQERGMKWRGQEFLRTMTSLQCTVTPS
jgi:hypothetical protein